MWPAILKLISKLLMLRIPTAIKIRGGYSRKVIVHPKMSKKSPKQAQNRVFVGFHKILSLLSAGNNLKWKTLQFFVLFQTLFLRELYFTNYRPKSMPAIRLQDSLIINVFGSFVQFYTQNFKLLTNMWSFPTRLQDSLMINISWLEQSMSNEVICFFGWVAPGVPSYPQTCLNL